MSVLTAYFALTKPRLLPLVLFSGLPALVLASGGWSNPAAFVWILIGIALAAGSANALNSFLEREPDARMERTRLRPLPSGRLDPQQALVFGLTLGVLGPGFLWWTSGPLAAAVALAGILFYVFVYTIWLKPRSPIAVVIGGVSGAVAPLIADAAIGASIGLEGALLFTIIFLWQPPHFWAITLYRRSEYEAAGFPLLVSRVGPGPVRWRIVVWSVVLVMATLLPWVLGILGAFYGVASLGFGTWFLFEGVRLLREQNDAAAQRVFRVSLFYLLGVFVAMLIDLAVLAT